MPRVSASFNGITDADSLSIEDAWWLACHAIEDACWLACCASWCTSVSDTHVKGILPVVSRGSTKCLTSTGILWLTAHPSGFSSESTLWITPWSSGFRKTSCIVANRDMHAAAIGPASE